MLSVISRGIMTVLIKPSTPRNKKYLAWIRTLPCCLCGRPQDVQAHHSESGGMGIKGSDYSALPLCPVCHGMMDTKRGRIDDVDKVIIRCLVGFIDGH